MATNLDSTTVAAGDDALATDYNELRLDVIKNAGDYETAGGTGDVITLATDAQYVAYAAGDVIRFQASALNTGVTTINVNSLGAQTIKKHNDQDLEAGDIESGQEVVIQYDGTNFQMVSQLGVFISSADKTTLTDGSEANALHEHDQTFIGAFQNNSVPASSDDDITFTPGFQAAVIEIHYQLIGNSGGSAIFSQGIVRYTATTLVSNYELYKGLLTNVNITANTEALITQTAPSSQGNNAVITLTINSITSTQFVVRSANSGGSNSGTTKYSVIAWK